MVIWKKAIALLLAAGMTLALAACGPTDGASGSASVQSETSSSQQEGAASPSSGGSSQEQSAPGSSASGESSEAPESSASDGSASDDASDDVPGASSAADGGAVFTNLPEPDMPVSFSIELGEIQTKDIDGNDFDGSYFSQYDLTMVNLWATWCGPCISELPSLGKLAEKYAEQGVGLVGLLADQDYSGARSLLDNAEAGYPCITLEDDTLLAISGTMQYVPTTFFVNRDGTIVGGYFVGARSEDDWSKLIDQYLAGMVS